MEDLYPSNNPGTSIPSADFSSLLLKIESIDKELRKMRGKKKRGKKSGKKKLKRRIKALEMENEQFKCFLQVFAMQWQNSFQQKPSWWMNVVNKFAPIALTTMGSAVINNLVQPRANVVSTRRLT